jgi:hypothetical protein
MGLEIQLFITLQLREGEPLLNIYSNLEQTYNFTTLSARTSFMFLTVPVSVENSLSSCHVFETVVFSINATTVGEQSYTVCFNIKLSG